MQQREYSNGSTRRYDLVLIGASSGGLEALIGLLQALPESYCLPTIVVLHQRANRESGVPEMLSRYTHLEVFEPDDKQKIETGTMYIAPPNYHLLIEPDRTIGLSLDAPMNYSRPSIDMAFTSAAEVYGDALIGCIFTGANSDGAQGVAQIKRRGGLVLVQDPEQATVHTMPLSAIRKTAVDAVLSLEEIAGRLAAECARSGAS